MVAIANILKFVSIFFSSALRRKCEKNRERKEQSMLLAVRGPVSPQFPRIASLADVLASAVLFSRRDRGTIEARRDPGPRSSVSGSFSSPPSPLSRRGHAISRSHGSITKVGTHFHVAATRRTGYLFFSVCPLLSLCLSNIPCFTMFSLREPIDFISRKSLTLAGNITRQFPHNLLYFFLSLSVNCLEKNH